MVAVLFIAGVQLPVMLLSEVLGNAGIVAPEQYGPAVANVGVIELVTTISIVVVVPHCPASGVKV